LANNGGNVVAVIISGVSLAVAAIFAYQANQIAQAAYQLSYFSNLPIISVVPIVDVGRDSETIEVRNDGRPINSYTVDLFTYVKIYNYEAHTTDYLSLMGYVDNKTNTNAPAGLLLTATDKSNYSKFEKFRSEFENAANHQVMVTRLALVIFDYIDVAGATHYDYYKLDYKTTHVSDEGTEIMIASNSNAQRLKAGTVDLRIRDLDGAKVWSAYITKALK
jgi:hypothetical protein